MKTFLRIFAAVLAFFAVIPLLCAAYGAHVTHDQLAASVTVLLIAACLIAPTIEFGPAPKINTKVG